MNLLAPLFLIGALAIAAPIVAHLVRRTTRNRVLFSATRFLEASPPRLDRRNHIEHPWLLLLRCLAILILAAGFARPFLREISPPVAPNAMVHHTVVVLDESASMQRRGLWDDAITRTRTAAARLGPNDRFALIVAARASRTLISSTAWMATAPADRAELVETALRGRTPGWDVTHLDTAIEAATEEITAMNEAGSAPGETQIVVVSDFTDSARLSGLAGRDWPSGITLTLESLTPSTTANASLHWLGWTTSADGTQQARLRLAHDGDATLPYRLQLSNAVDGRVQGDAMVVTLAPRETRAVTLPVPANHATPLRVDLTGDDEPFDNTVWLVLPENRSFSMPYLGTGDASDSRTALFYIARAMDGWRDPAVKPQTIAPAEVKLPEASLFVVDAALPVATTDVLRSRLESGAFALVLARDADVLATAGALASENGWSLGPPSGRADAMLADISFRHPLFAPFADPRFSDFTRIRFWKTTPIALPSGSAAGVVARFDDGMPAVIEISVGRGILIVWAGDWTPAASQWVLSTKFVPWFQSLARRAVGGPPPTAMMDVGDIRSQPTPADAAALQSPGVIQISDGRSPRWLALNVPSTESRTGTLSLDTWEQLGVPLATLERPAPDSQRSPEQEASIRSGSAAAVRLEADQKLWRWLLLAAAVVLAIESIAATRAATRTSRPVSTPA